MSAHLLAIAVGPVQEFIAAARRTRDLWFGSHLLSEISKATALAVHNHGGELIFPPRSSAVELKPGSSLNVANIIVAELTDAKPESIALAAKEAAKSRWRQFADAVLEDHTSVIRRDIWLDQVDDVIEFRAAWVPLGGPYRSARSQLMRLLAGRKNCRDFLVANGRVGVPKSSLDGRRESVLKDHRVDPWPKHHRRRLRVREGEQLDAIGLVKRTWVPGDGAVGYPSVSRVAADPWIRGLIETRGEQVLRPILTACRELGTQVIHEINTQLYRHYSAFRYEGTAVFRTRHHELREEAELSDAELKPLADALRGLIHMAGEPDPYLAVLVADGDRMGRALSQLSSKEEHQAFSQQLSQFAGEVRTIVHEHNRGVLVYSGGDDVLAFVPVDQCLPCARALHKKFAELMRPWTQRTGIKLTLSVGLAIAHFLENLEDLLDYGRAAEKHAKIPKVEDAGQSERDGIAVHVRKRGGGLVAVRANWEAEEGLDGQLVKLAELVNSQAISGRVAYDLFRVADVYKDWPKETVTDAIRRDALRVIKAKQPRGVSEMDQVKNLLSEQKMNAESLHRLGDKLLIARQIAIAVRQAEGRSALEEVPA